MYIKYIDECGYDWAMRGIGLSYKRKYSRFKAGQIAKKLSHKDGGHNKFLESMQVWLEIKAPLYWWKQFDTYRVGVTKQSESTMHTIMRKPLTQEDFQYPIFTNTLKDLNSAIEWGDFATVNNNLPSGYLQTRIVNTNYKTLRHICQQRKVHKLHEWTYFCDYVQKKLKYSEFIKEL